MAGELRAGFGARSDDRRNFVIVNARDHGRDHYADGNFSRAQLRDRIQTRCRSRCPRLENALKFWIQRRNRKIHRHGVVPRQFHQNVDVARHQPIFRQNADRVPKFREHLETTASDPQLALDRLITVGHAAHHQQLWFPFRRRQLGFEQSRRVRLHHDA